MAEDITYFRFMSEVRSFLAKLLKDPIGAQPSRYLKNRGVTRKWLVDNLISREVLERHEKILDPTNSDEKKAKYVVKFKVRKKDFEKRIYKIYIKKFENNVNESVFADEDIMKEKILNGPDGDTYRKRGGINEEGEGGGAIGGATGCDSVGSETSRGDVGFDVPFGMVERRPIGGRPKEKEKGNNNKPENILGKNLVAEKKMARKIYITEEQFKTLVESEIGGATTISSVASQTSDGQLGPVRPGCMTFRKSNGKLDNSAFERKPGFSVRRVGEDK